MTTAVGLTVSKIGSGQRLKWSGYNEIYYNSLKMQFSTIYIIEILNVALAGVYTL